MSAEIVEIVTSTSSGVEIFEDNHVIEVTELHPVVEILSQRSGPDLSAPYNPPDVPVAVIDVYADQQPDVVEVMLAQGPPGEKGADGSSVNTGYEHTQDTPQMLWTVVHNLGFKPAGVLVHDINGVETEPLVLASTAQAVLLKFHDPTAGTAIVS